MLATCLTNVCLFPELTVQLLLGRLLIYSASYKSTNNSQVLTIEILACAKSQSTYENLPADLQEKNPKG